ncbi:hypothetical protein Bca101_063536 [Brassica carinata]
MTRWSPISPLIACPMVNDDRKRKEPASPRIFYDDDDVYVAISEDDDEAQENTNAGKGKEPVVVRSSKKHGGVVGSSSVSHTSRKRVGAGAKNVGRLDLNVELSNEVEDGRNEGNNGVGRNREVDNIIEGIGFFEGLDEFLSSLPILSVVGDDKIKAT